MRIYRFSYTGCCWFFIRSGLDFEFAMIETRRSRENVSFLNTSTFICLYIVISTRHLIKNRKIKNEKNLSNCSFVRLLIANDIKRFDSLLKTTTKNLRILNFYFYPSSFLSYIILYYILYFILLSQASSFKFHIIFILINLIDERNNFQIDFC